MLRSYFLAADGTLIKDLDPLSMKQAMESRKGVLWVDIEAPTPDEVASLG